MIRGHFSLLWLKATIFERLQKGYLWPEATKVRCGLRVQYLRRKVATVCCGQMPEYLWAHREATCNQLPLKFIVIKSYSIWVITETIFTTRCCPSLLCLMATTFQRPPRPALLHNIIENLCKLHEILSNWLCQNFNCNILNK